MANPVRGGKSAQMPPITTPLVDSTGVINLDWYRSLVDVWQKSGGTTSATLATVQQTATDAVTTANTAEKTAALAESVATTANTTANAALGVANTAETTGTNALTLATTINDGALFKVRNLADVPSPSLARVNLGVATIPIAFRFDTLSSGLRVYVPVVQSITVPVSFTGTKTFAGTFPSADAVFTVNYVRGASTNLIGTITLINGGNSAALFSSSAVNLIAGDTLQIICPSPPDATLANLGITLMTQLT